MYKKILVPSDGSDTAAKGLHEAVRLARALNAKVRVLHVANDLVLDPAVVPSALYERLIEGVRVTGEKILADARAYGYQHNVEIETELKQVIGIRASAVIVAAATQWQAELIVMGTHGRRGLQRLALGSDAEAVLRSSPVPVLTVRAMANVDAGFARGIIRGSEV